MTRMLCRYEQDQRFEKPVATFQQAYTLVRDEWCVCPLKRVRLQSTSDLGAAHSHPPCVCPTYTVPPYMGVHSIVVPCMLARDASQVTSEHPLALACPALSCEGCTACMLDRISVRRIVRSTQHAGQRMRTLARSNGGCCW
eukprot:9476313-Pyramimonas_sp.AAC.2